MNTTEIAQFIIETIRSQPRILGSELGTKVKSRFHNADFTSYRNLRGFIAQHCANEVVAVEKKGMDWVWDCKTPDLSLPPETPSHALRFGTGQKFKPTPWKVFVNANVPGKLAVNSITGDLLTVPDYDQLAAPWKEIPKLTEEENQQVARAFLESVDGSDRNVLEPILQQINPWAEWFACLKQVRGGCYWRNWGEYRLTAISKLFADRLRALDYSEDVIKVATDNLRASRNWRNEKSGQDREHQSNYECAQLKTIIHRVVDSLSDDELRRLWLPVGAIVDALDKKH